MLDIKITGLDEFERLLKQLERNARSIGGKRLVDLSDLLNPEFLGRHTKFTSLEQLFEESPFQIETQEDFDALDERELDSFIRASTRFRSWQDILDEGANEWAEKKLFQGVKKNC